MNFQLATYEQMTGVPANVPAYTCVAEGNGFFFAKKGAMVADQGQFKYEKVLLDPNAGANVMQGVLNQVARRLTGENMEIMKVTGNGRVFLAFEGRNVTVVPLQPGEAVGVESENLLAFTGNLKYGVKFIGAGVLSQKGLFTTNIQNQSGQPGYVAVITDGNAVVIHSPCKVDPDAIICWTGPDPGLKMDVNWKTIIGQTSGESYMFEFKNPGQIVVIQPSERKAGVSLSIDAGAPAGTQSSAFGNSMDNMGNTVDGAGNAINQAANMLGRFLR
ncbi:MAG: AIM24 family protein [Bacillota bacterium]